MNIDILISGGFVGIEKTIDQITVSVPIGYLTDHLISKIKTDIDKMNEVFKLQILVDKIFQKLSTTKNAIYRDDDDREVELEFHQDITELKKIQKLIETFDSFDLNHIQYWKNPSDHIDFDKLHLFFDQGIVLKNNAIFMEHPYSAQKRYVNGETELIKLYCFLLDQLIDILGIDFCLFTEISKEYEQIHHLSQLFRYDYLASHDVFKRDINVFHLFSNVENIALISKLQHILIEIDKNTQVKNRKYDLYYDVIDFFLDLSRGVDGGKSQWGFQKFSLVWEHIAFSYFKGFDVLFNDMGVGENAKGIDDLLKVSLLEIEKKRSLKPDLFVGIDVRYYLIDFKYVDGGFFKKTSEPKFKNDVSKQILYKIALGTQYTIEENIFIYPEYIDHPKTYFHHHLCIFNDNKDVNYKGNRTGLFCIGMNFRDAIAIFFDEYSKVNNTIDPVVNSNSVISINPEPDIIIPFQFEIGCII